MRGVFEVSPPHNAKSVIKAQEENQKSYSLRVAFSDTPKKPPFKYQDNMHVAPQAILSLLFTLPLAKTQIFIAIFVGDRSGIKSCAPQMSAKTIVFPLQVHLHFTITPPDRC
jgi:hypothetical protein